MCMKLKKPMILVVNKIDRLVLELKLPPSDAYYKIRHTIDEFNLAVQKYRAFVPSLEKTYYSPIHQNVVFSSTYY